MSKIGTITCMARPSGYSHTTYRRGGVEWPILEIGKTEKGAKTVEVHGEPAGPDTLSKDGMLKVLADPRMIVEGTDFVLSHMGLLPEGSTTCNLVKPGSLYGITGISLTGVAPRKEARAATPDREPMLAEAESLGIEGASEMADAVLAEAIARKKAEIRESEKAKGRKSKTKGE